MSAGLLNSAIDSTASWRQSALDLLSRQLSNSSAEHHDFVATDSAIAELSTFDEGDNSFAADGHLLDDLATSLATGPAGSDQLSL